MTRDTRRMQTRRLTPRRIYQARVHSPPRKATRELHLFEVRARIVGDRSRYLAIRLLARRFAERAKKERKKKRSRSKFEASDAAGQRDRVLYRCTVCSAILLFSFRFKSQKSQIYLISS